MAAPAAGAAGRAAAVRELFRPESRWATPLLRPASFCGLLLVYGVSTWLPQMMRAEGYGLSSSASFLMVIHAGGIFGLLIAGRVADRFGAVRVSAIWLVLTAAGALLLSDHLPLGAPYAVVEQRLPRQRARGGARLGHRSPLARPRWARPPRTPDTQPLDPLSLTPTPTRRGDSTMDLHTRATSGQPRSRRVPLALAGAGTAVAAAAPLGTTAGATPSPAAAKAPAAKVQVVKDLAYAPAQPAGTEGHLLDLHVPRSKKPVPLVISTRGSAWLADNGRRDADKVAAELNPAGYAVAGVSIRSSSQARFPSQLHDIKAAIRWLRAHAKTYNLDPKRVAVMGDSSGGWTSAMAAVTSNNPAMEGDVGISGPSSAVQAAIPFYPPTDFLQMDAHMPDNCAEFNAIMGTTGCHNDPRSPESRLLGCPITECPPTQAAAANPLTYIGGQPIPPTLVLHGEPDALVPYHQGRLLYDKLAATGHDTRMISFPKAAHGTLFEMLSDDATREGAYEEAARGGHSTPARPVTPTWNTVISFLDQHLRQPRRAASTGAMSSGRDGSLFS